MTVLDWGLLVAYLLGVIGLSYQLSKSQFSPDDYYVGGRKLPWWAVGISTMATQSSANSFVGIPAYVALAEGGGLSWLQFELAMPLAMAAVMILLIRRFRELNLVSVYGYLEKRFDGSTRRALAVVFLLSRGLAAGVGIYASGVVLSTCLGLSIGWCMVLVGVATIIYDSLGGMSAVVWTDVVQMVVLVGGIILCIALAVSDVGGIAEVLSAFEPERLEGLRYEHGLGDGSQAPMWGFLVGGIFMYMSYYGVDQSQMQRALSAPSVADTKRSLVFNGIARFPLTVLYLLMGLAIGAAFMQDDTLMAGVQDGNFNAMVPLYVLERLPAGVRGILFASILAAAMSTLDSYLNSLSASTMQDLIIPWMAKRGHGIDARRALNYSRATTVGWGLVITAFGFVAGGMATTVVEAINKVGSLFYGPMLAVFGLGLLTRRATGGGALAGLVAGVLLNLALWQGLGDIFWMWWNVSGAIATFVVGYGLSFFGTAPAAHQLRGTLAATDGLWEHERPWLWVYGVLLGYFVLLMLISAFSADLLGLLR